MMTMIRILPKGRRKFCWYLITSQFKRKAFNHHSMSFLVSTLLLITCNLSSIHGVAIKYNESDIDKKLSLSSFDSEDYISFDRTINGNEKQLINSSIPNFSGNDNRSTTNDEYFDQLTINNPCLIHYCQKGRECIIDLNTNQPICICQRHCSQRKRPICGSNGQIYKNHCRLHQASCLLDLPITYQRLQKCLKKISKTSNKLTHSKSLSKIKINQLKKNPKQSSTTYNDDDEHILHPHETIVAYEKQEKEKGKEKEMEQEIRPPKKNDNDDEEEKLIKSKEKPLRNNGKSDFSISSTSSKNNNEIDFIETSILEHKKMCTSQEYEIMKDNLLLFNHARLMSQDNNHSKDFLVSIMFSHYDQNNDAYLETEELNQISIDEHLEELSNGCVLEDMLAFDDLNNDRRLSINEFYQAFSKLYSVSVVSLDKALETNHLSARVGDNVEIKCDVTGSPSPPIIWRRDDVDLSTLNIDDIRVFSDGSLYLTRIQLVHSGNYTCHAQRNKDVVQTHILNVYTIPQVLVMPRIQSKRPGENGEMWCHVTGDPLPKVEWLKNDERLNLNIPDKYEIIGNGTALKMHNIQYSDTGAYMCQATNIGGTVRDISSLIVQEEPTPTVLNEARKFFVFHEYGVSIYEPSACRLYHQIQGTDIIPGTQEYVCGEKGVKCLWGRAINGGTRYIYASQPTLDRVIVISTIQMVVVDVIQTDKYPVELHYIQKLDQIWILNWRYEHNIDAKTIQVIREAGQKRKHHTVHPEPIDGQFDLVRDLFLPSSELEQPHFSYNYGYVTHKNQRGLYKLDLANLRYTKSVDLTLHNCVPENIEFSALYGFVVLSCREPITNRPQGQLVLDYLTDAVLTTKPSLFGIPKISPDSRHLVTIQHNLSEVVIVVQKITNNGLEFLFDVKTTLNISDVTFYESQTTHGYDLFASANDKENILYLNLCTGKVEMITGVGLPIPTSSIEWGNPGRVIRSSGLFGLYMLTTANNALFVINGRARTVNCEIGGVEHPTSIVWSHSLQNLGTNQSPSFYNES